MGEFQCRSIKCEGLKLVMGACIASYGRISVMGACTVRGGSSSWKLVLRVI